MNAPSFSCCNLPAISASSKSQVFLYWVMSENFKRGLTDKRTSLAAFYILILAAQTWKDATMWN
jgi:hypothetical protein